MSQKFVQSIDTRKIIEQPKHILIHMQKKLRRNSVNHTQIVFKLVKDLIIWFHEIWPAQAIIYLSLLC